MSEESSSDDGVALSTLLANPGRPRHYFGS